MERGEEEERGAAAEDFACFNTALLMVSFKPPPLPREREGGGGGGREGGEREISTYNIRTCILCRMEHSLHILLSSVHFVPYRALFAHPILERTFCAI